MNIPANLTREPAFKKLEQKVGRVAMRCLVAIGLYVQSSRKTSVLIEDKDDLYTLCELNEGEVNKDTLWSSLIGVWLVPEGHERPSKYRFPLFEDNNKKLFHCWKNGEITKAKLTLIQAPSEPSDGCPN